MARAVAPLVTWDCKRCLKRFPKTDEYFTVNHRSGKLMTTCKECRARVDHARWEATGRSKVKENAALFRERNRRYHAENREREISKARENHREVRREAIASYGGACECCGESHVEFLGIDHVNNDGHLHRRSGIGGNIYFWLKKQGFPKDGRFRVLCHNCNMSRSLYGRCPHNGPVPYVSLARTLNEAKRKAELAGPLLVEDRRREGW